MTDTSGHLPECPSSSPDPLAADCCCSRLSAVGRRMMDENAPVFWHAGFSNGYAAGLDAAREAVAGAKVVDVDQVYVLDESTHFTWKRKALAAIDALREEQAPPPLPPSVGVPSKPMWPLREEQK